MERTVDNTKELNGILTFKTYTNIIETLQGDFRGELEWCNDLINNEWTRSNLVIDLEGALIREQDPVSINKNHNNDMKEIPDLEEDGSFPHKYVLIKHLQQCSLQLIKTDNKIPIIFVAAQGNVIKESVYLKALSNETFEELFTSLTWWSSMKTIGIFNKMNFTKYQSNLNKNELENFNKEEHILFCQLNCYGPLPSNANVTILENMPDIDFIESNDHDNSTMDWSWFSTMGVLKSNGVIDLLSQSDGSLIYSLNICELLRSEIQIMNRSLLNSDLFLQISSLKSLRRQMQVSEKVSFFQSDKETISTTQDIILGFPLRIDLEDWFLALKSFAIAEQLSLNGIDTSNKLRIFNLLQIDILEANLEAISLASNKSRFALHIEIILWDKVVAKTPQIFNSNTPFWREEFSLQEDVRIENIAIMLIQTTFENKIPTSKLIGTVHIDKTMLFDKRLENETRLPLYSYEHENFQLGTLCLKLKYNLQFLLPATNYRKLENQLSTIPVSLVIDNIYQVLEAPNSPYDLPHISLTCLNVFQSLGRDIEWFQGLIAREVNNIDEILLRNSNNNSTNVHVYNSLFRGNSLFTVSIEKYFYRIGSEYLNQALGEILQDIICDTRSCECDPNRIKFSTETEKEALLSENRTRLLMWTSKIWNAIDETSNDFPSQIKDILKSVRISLEKIFINDDNNAILHCISGILFLRFFCPVILNPKLFNLTEYHLTDNTRRTLTLVAKLLMNLATLTFFGAKEMWMVDLNDFIKDHKDDLLDYLERVTHKKLDFTSKALKLTSNMPRPSIMLNNIIMRDLPSLPYLIDKTLQETEFIKILSVLDYFKKDYLNYQENKILDDMDDEKSSERAEIGELEFEDITQNNTETFDEDFLKTLKIKDNSEENNSVTDSPHDKIVITNVKSKKVILEQLAGEVNLLQYKINYLISIHSGYEYPTDSILDDTEYAKRLAKALFYQSDNHIVIDQDKMFATKEGLIRLFSTRTNGFNYLELNENKYNGKNSVSSTSLISNSSIESEDNKRSFNVDLGLLPKRRIENLRNRTFSKTTKNEPPSSPDISNKSKVERRGSRITRFFNKMKSSD